MGPALSSVLICGCASSLPASRSIKRKFETVWTINLAAIPCKIEPDLVIAIDDFRRDEAAEPGYVARLFAGHAAPVLTTIPYPEWPRSQAYPLSWVIEQLGCPPPIARRLFDNSVNYALALAIARGARHIGLYGIGFTDGGQDWDEIGERDWEGSKYYGDLRPDWFKYHGDRALFTRAPTEPGGEACHLLIGMAMEAGIEFSFWESTLLNLDRESYFYGWSAQPDV